MARHKLSRSECAPSAAQVGPEDANDNDNDDASDNYHRRPFSCDHNCHNTCSRSVAACLIKSRPLGHQSFSEMLLFTSPVAMEQAASVIIIPACRPEEAGGSSDGPKMASLRKILNDEASLIDETYRCVWRLRLDGLYVVSKLSQLGFRLDQLCVSPHDGVHTWSMQCDDKPLSSSYDRPRLEHSEENCSLSVAKKPVQNGGDSGADSLTRRSTSVSRRTPSSLMMGAKGFVAFGEQNAEDSVVMNMAISGGNPANSVNSAVVVKTSNQASFGTRANIRRRLPVRFTLPNYRVPKTSTNRNNPANTTGTRADASFIPFGAEPNSMSTVAVRPSSHRPVLLMDRLELENSVLPPVSIVPDGENFVATSCGNDINISSVANNDGAKLNGGREEEMDSEECDGAAQEQPQRHVTVGVACEIVMEADANIKALSDAVGRRQPSAAYDADQSTLLPRVDDINARGAISDPVAPSLSTPTLNMQLRHKFRSSNRLREMHDRTASAAAADVAVAADFASSSRGRQIIKNKNKIEAANSVVTARRARAGRKVAGEVLKSNKPPSDDDEEPMPKKKTRSRSNLHESAITERATRAVSATRSGAADVQPARKQTFRKRRITHGERENLTNRLPPLQPNRHAGADASKDNDVQLEHKPVGAGTAGGNANASGQKQLNFACLSRQLLRKNIPAWLEPGDAASGGATRLMLVNGEMLMECEQGSGKLVPVKPMPATSSEYRRIRDQCFPK